MNRFRVPFRLYRSHIVPPERLLSVAWIETDHGMVRVVVCVVQVQHDPSHELLTSGMHHSFFFQGVRFFEYLTARGRCSRQTPSPPPVGQLDRTAARDGYQMCFLSAVQRSRALICAVETAWTRPTVEALINRPLAMSQSVMPIVLPSATPALLTLRAEVSPRLAICLRCVRSGSTPPCT